jgi:DNA end-binding protein Ku
MSARPVWQGHLRLSLVSCPVKLFNATTNAERVSFHMLNRATHNRQRQQMVDPETDEVVERDDQISGYEIEKGRYVTVEPDEIAALRLESTQTIDIERFVDRADIDIVFWDGPYYLVPDGDIAEEAFAVIREAMRARDVVGLGRVVLSSRERQVALEPRGNGILLSRLRAAAEVRDSDEFFDDVPDAAVDDEMLAIAEQIIDKKHGKFEPATFVDHYQQALHDLVEAKRKGETPVAPKVSEPGKVVNLFDALKKSLDQTASSGSGSGSGGGRAKPATRPKSAGRRAPKQKAAKGRKAS